MPKTTFSNSLTGKTLAPGEEKTGGMRFTS